MGKDAKYYGMTRVWKRYGLLFKGLMNEYSFEKALEHHIQSRTEIDESFIKDLKENSDESGLEEIASSFDNTKNLELMLNHINLSDK